ncbi:carotenoid oxygenase family protein [Paremcibacter congregatus]|uniref:carotenoid oxygenase family protein n=1 Tax=Paremcibacter congregatus TaxID=2043170 RepID=UPI003A93F234
MPLHSREDEGSILTLVYDCHDQKSHILILDATDLVEQARIQLSQVIPLTFHGSWVGKTPPDPLRD